MKTGIAVLALGILVAAAQPAAAQTLTYKSNSVHRTTTLSQRVSAQHLVARAQASRVQRSAARRQLTQQVRALQMMKDRVGQRPRYSPSNSQTRAYVQDRIERNRNRVKARRVPGEIRPGVRIVQRRLATDEEMRGYRSRPTPHQRAARAGRIAH